MFSNFGKIKKVFALFMILALALSLSCCGKKEEQPQGGFSDVEISEKEKEKENPKNTFTQLPEPLGLTYTTQEIPYARQQFQVPDCFLMLPQTARHIAFSGSGDFEGVQLHLYTDIPDWFGIECDPEWQDRSAMDVWDRFDDDVFVDYSIKKEKCRLDYPLMPTAFDIETGIEDFHKVCGYIFDCAPFRSKYDSNVISEYRLYGYGYVFDHVSCLWTAIYPVEKQADVEALLSYIVSTVKALDVKPAAYKQVQIDDFILSVPEDLNQVSINGRQFVYVSPHYNVSQYTGMGFAVYPFLELNAHDFSSLIRAAVGSDLEYKCVRVDHKENIDFNGTIVKEADKYEAIVLDIPGDQMYERAHNVVFWVYHFGNADDKVLIFFDHSARFDDHYEEILNNSLKKTFKYVGN